MSWIAATALFVIVGFALAFGFSEWLVRRRARAGGDDRPSPG